MGPLGEDEMTPRVAGLSEARRLLPRRFTWSPASFFAASLPSSLHSTPPNTWLGNPPTSPDEPCFLPSLNGEGKGLQVRQRLGWKSPLLSMWEGGHQRGSIRYMTSLVQASLGRAPPLPKSTWTSRGMRVLQPGLGPIP